ncbi:putative glycosyltransferase 7 [Salvia divinorum]|uniref:Glycosyltransferase 7 n=1 Tax=Salvia divinorum TaxID=28513 RepID=A0ABD1I8V9_SALDI
MMSPSHSLAAMPKRSKAILSALFRLGSGALVVFMFVSTFWSSFPTTPTPSTPTTPPPSAATTPRSVTSTTTPT